MKVQVSFDPGGGGSLEVWRDGFQIVKYQGAIGFTGAAYYWKEGIYRAPAAETITVDYRNLHVTSVQASAPTMSTQPASGAGERLRVPLLRPSGWTQPLARRLAVYAPRNIKVARGAEDLDHAR